MAIHFKKLLEVKTRVSTAVSLGLTAFKKYKIFRDQNEFVCLVYRYSFNIVLAAILLRTVFSLLNVLCIVNLARWGRILCAHSQFVNWINS